ncbi:MAG: hypothetical protein IPL52_18005 [Flavobacteriales bacterium]|nr:hypothetical protein [Flavobacteriales bacterium]
MRSSTAGAGHVVLPNKAKAFARSINLRSVDDGSSARTLALMGMERQLDPWEKPQEVYIRMKHLTREREISSKHSPRQRTSCTLKRPAPSATPYTIKRLKGRIGFLERQVKEVETDLRALIRREKELEERIARVCTAPGIGWLTMTIILAGNQRLPHGAQPTPTDQVRRARRGEA